MVRAQNRHLARNEGVRRVIGVRRGLQIALAAGLAIGYAQVAAAGPQDERVVRGAASFSRSGHETVIHAGHNAVIHYQSFNIAPHQTVRFVQPDASSRVLNRITGADPSRIDGTLIANGRVYIVNPAGVYFGNGATVNVGAIYAAAGTMTDSDFLAGVDRFTGLSGRVSNLGTIRAREVHFIGRTVENFGTLVTPEGLVTMSAGDDVLIGRLEGGVFARIESREGSAGGELRQDGRIEADGGRVMMGTGDEFALAIGADAYVRAAQVRANGGGARHAVRVEGTIDARDQGPGGTGGEVEILGDRIALLGAEIDASGAGGGGRVRVGGGYQGGEGLRAAERVYVDRGSVIRADATVAGRGGDVVVWADGLTSYHGSIFARGGVFGGDGGSVEVSGKTFLRFDGAVDVSSPLGRAGVVLLDPRDITIVETGADDADLTATGILFGAAESTDDFTISAAALEALVGDIELQAQRDLTVAFALNLANQTAGESVTFRAGRDIRLNAGVTTGGGDLLLLANDATTPAPPGAQNGSVFVSAPVNLAGGSFTSSGVGFTSTALITAGDATLTHTGAMSLGAMTLGAGGMDATTSATIATTGLLNITGDAVFNAGGLITLSQITPGGSILLTTPGNASVTSTGPIEFEALTTIGGTLAATAQSGTITNNGALSVGGISTFTANTPGIPPLGIDLSDFSAGGAVALNTTAGARVGATGGLALGASSIGGALTATAASGNLTDTGVIGVGGNATLSAPSGAITLNNSFNVAGNTLLNSSGNATFVSSAAVTLGDSTVGGNLNVTSGGALADSGAVSVAGAGAFIGNSINLDQTSVGTTVRLTSLGNATFAAASGLQLGGGASVVGGTATLNAGAGALTGTGLQAASAGLTGTSINLTGVSVPGALTLNTAGNATIGATSAVTLGTGSSIGAGLNVTTSAGSITDAGTVTVTGAVTLNAAGAISVDTFNTSGGAYTLTAGSGGATVVNQNAVTIAGATVSGPLRVTGGGSVTNTGPITVTNATGTPSLFSSTAAGFINLGQGGTFSATGPISLNTVSGNATLVGISGLNLGATSVAGSLTVAAQAGAITNTSGTVAATGAASFTTFAGNITVNNLAVTSPVTLSGSANVTLSNTGNLALAGSVGGNLIATSTGTLTDSGPLTVAGGSVLSGSGGIVFDQTTFTGTVGLFTGANATVTAPTLVLAGSTVSGDLFATASTGAMAGAGATVNVDGNAEFVSVGNLSFPALNVAGSVLASSSAGSVALTNAGTLRLATGTSASTTLTATATTGDLLNLGAVSAGGAVSLQALAGDVEISGLATPSTVRLRASGDVAYSAPSITLGGGGSEAGGLMDLRATAGSLTGTGLVATDARLEATGAITLGGVQVSDELLVLSGGDATLNATGAAGIILAPGSTIDGDLTLFTPTGDIRDAGAVTVLGSAIDLHAGGGSIDLGSTIGAGATWRLRAGTDARVSTPSLSLNVATSEIGGDLTLVTDTLIPVGAWSGSLGSGGLFTLAPRTLGRPIFLGSATGPGLEFSSADLAELATTGFGSLGFGEPGASPVTIGATTFNLPTIVRGSTIGASGPITTGGAALTLEATNTLTLSGTINTGAGALDLSGPITLAGVTTLQGGALTVTDTIDGGSGLTVSVATADFGGAIGQGVPLASLNLTTTGGAGSLGSVRTVGGQTYTNASTLTLTGDLRSTGGGTIAFAGPVQLAGAGGSREIRVDNAGAGTNAITFAGTVDGARALDLIVAPARARFGASVGGSVRPLGLSSDGGLTLLGEVAIDGPLHVGGSLLLNAPAISITTAGGSASLLGGVQGGSAFTLNTGAGEVEIGTGIGQVTPLLSMSVVGGAVTLPSVGTALGSGVNGTLSVTASGPLDLAGSNYRAGTIVLTAGGGHRLHQNTTLRASAGQLALLGGPVEMGSFDLDLNGVGGGVTLAGATGSAASDLTIHAGGLASLGPIGSGAGRLGSIRITAPDVNLNAAVFGTLFEAQPIAPTDTITLGGAGGGGFALTGAEMARLADGFDSITFGRAGGQHAVDLRGFAFTDPLFVRTPLGAVTITGDLIGSGNAALDLAASAVTLGGAIATSGGAVRFGGATTVGGPGVRVVDAGGGGVTFEHAVQGPGGLVVRGGAVRFDGNLGGATGLGLFDAEGASVRLGGAVVRASSARLVSAGELLLAGGALDVETTGGDAVLAGSVIRLAAGSTGASVRTNGGDARFLGAFDASGAGGAPTLLIDAGSGDVSASDPIGAGGAFASAAIQGEGVSLVGVRTTGAQSVTGQSLTLSGLFASSTSGSLIYTGPTTLAGDVEARSAGGTGQDVRFGRVDGPFTLTLDAGSNGAIRTGEIGLTQPLAGVELRGTSVELASVITDGAILVDAPALLGGVVRSLSDGVTFERSLTLTGPSTIEGRGGDVRLLGAVDGASALALIAPGREVAVSAPIGDATPLLSLDAAGATLRFGDVSTSGGQTYAGALTLAGELSSTNAGVTIGGATTLAGDSAVLAPSLGVGIGSIDGPFALRLDTGANDLDLSAGIGQSLTIGRLTVERAGAVAFGAARADSVRIENVSGVVTIPGTVVLSGTDGLLARSGGLTLTGRLESAGDLAIETAGATLIGASADLSAFTGSILQTGPGAVRLEQDLRLSGGGLSFDGPVTLGAGVGEFAGSGIAFGGGLEPAGPGVALVLASPGAMRLGGDVGGATPFASVTTSGGGMTELGGSVFATGEVFFGGDAVLVGDTRIDGRQGVRFGGGIESDSDGMHALEIAVDTSDIGRDLPLVRFGGRVGVVNRPRSLEINLSGRGGVAAEVPTIVFYDESSILDAPSAANGLFFRVSETFAVGRGEKIAAVGPVGIDAGVSASFGDISSLSDIDVVSPRIVLLLRPPQPVFDPVLQAATPESSDQGIDFVSLTAIRFSTTPELDGTGGAPQFATADAGNITSSLADQFSIRAFTTLNRDDLIRGDQYFDLRAQGATNTNVAEALAGAAPRTDASRSVVSELAVGAAQGEQLQRLGVFPKELTPEQLVEFLVGRAVYMDLNPEAAVQASAARVTVDRLSERIVSSVLATYQSVFGDSGGGEREAEIRDRLDEAVNDYLANRSDEIIDPVAFRGFLEFNERHAASAQDVRELRRLFDELSLLGLSPLELGVAREVLLGGIRPDIMTTEELLGVILAPVPSLRSVPPGPAGAGSADEPTPVPTDASGEREG
ncbi:MAG: filamentous hemagglutinin N-terminal domain-containing protein [Phycisphaerales bacterium]|nr:MAG: filamentous hemagglutinin N-terminal domain-containing protein [Phycisphaerales bacterium]